MSACPLVREIVEPEQWRLDQETYEELTGAELEVREGVSDIIEPSTLFDRTSPLPNDRDDEDGYGEDEDEQVG